LCWRDVKSRRSHFKLIALIRDRLIRGHLIRGHLIHGRKEKLPQINYRYSQRKPSTQNKILPNLTTPKRRNLHQMGVAESYTFAGLIPYSLNSPFFGAKASAYEMSHAAIWRDCTVWH
jgi:hypothetical protein